VAALIQSALEEIRQGHGKYAAKVSGMVSKMDDFDTFLASNLPISNFQPQNNYQ